MRIELRGRRRSSRSRCDGEPESRTGNGEAGRQTAAKRWWRGDAAAGACSGQGARRGLWRVDASLSLPSADRGLSATPAPVSSVVFLFVLGSGQSQLCSRRFFRSFSFVFSFCSVHCRLQSAAAMAGATSHSQRRFLASSIVFSLRSAWSWRASVHCARGLPVWLFVAGPVRQCQQPTRPPRLSPPCPVASGVFSLVVSGECSYCPPA